MSRLHTPTALRLVKNGGTIPKDYRNPANNRDAEPQLAPASDLSAPPGTPEHVIDVWDRVVPLVAAMGVVAEQDMEALSDLCHAIADRDACRDRLAAPMLSKAGDVLSKAGDPNMSWLGAQGQTYRLRPDVGLLNKLDAKVLLLQSHFGLTPSSRARVSVAPRKGPVSLKEKYFTKGSGK